MVFRSRCTSARGFESLSSRVDYRYFIGGKVTEGWSSTTYNPPYRSLPAELSATPTWRTAGTMSTQSSVGMPSSILFDYSFSTGSRQQLTVPAGSFSAVPITLFTGAASSTSYYAPGVGFLSTASAGYLSELQSYTP
jgi:hypothetical protein